MFHRIGRKADVDANADQQSNEPARMGMLLTLPVLRGDSFSFNGIAVKELPTLATIVNGDNDFLEGSNYMAGRIPDAVNRAYGEFLATL